MNDASARVSAKWIRSAGRGTPSRNPGGRPPNSPIGSARVGVLVVLPCHHAQRRKRVFRRQREHRNVIERAAGRHHARRHESEPRLQSADDVEACRHPPGTCRVGAERARHDPPRDRDGRARARAAGNKIGADRVARDAVGRADTDEAGRELIEIGLADDDRSGGPKPGDSRRIANGPIGVGRAAGVGLTPATSMLSLTATSTPSSGSADRSVARFCFSGSAWTSARHAAKRKSRDRSRLRSARKSAVWYRASAPPSRGARLRSTSRSLSRSSLFSRRHTSSDAAQNWAK